MPMRLLRLVLTLTMLGHSAARGNGDDRDDLFTLNVTMPGYHSSKEDQIVFVQYRLPDEELFIVGYRPLVSMATAHHMNMVACETPASSSPYWTDGLIGCGTGARMLLYGWDRDALPFLFLDDIGIAVGKNTPYKYLVVNIHFVPIVKNDYSGNQLLLTRKRQKYLAGVMSGGAETFSLPPLAKSVKTPFSCQYQGPKISMFAVGVHAHRWARVNSLYRVRNSTVVQIAKVDPQQIHQSYRLSTPVDIVSGDFIVGQCVFDNTENRTIKMGLSHNDEMCNVMAGYWYERDDNPTSGGRVPFEACWGNLHPDISALIPRDSEIAPPVPSTGGAKRTLALTAVVAFLLLLIIGGFLFWKKPYSLHGQVRPSGWCHRRKEFDPLQQQSDEDEEIEF